MAIIHQAAGSQLIIGVIFMIFNKTKSLIIVSLLVSCSSLFAQSYNSSQSTASAYLQGNNASSTPPSATGYQSSGNTGPSQVSHSSHSSHATPPSSYQSSGGHASNQVGHNSHSSEDISFSVNGPDFRASFSSNPDETYFESRGRNEHRHRHLGPRWIDAFPGSPLGPEVVMGGGESGRIYYICHAPYQGGVHPGKIVKGRCNFSWGGREIATNQYQVLVSHNPLSFRAAGLGYVPPNAIPGGYENGKPLYICQAEYNGGMHPGKIIGENCNIAWGGREILLPHYNVLVG